MNLDEAVVLRTFANEVEANVAASCLRSQGIETHIQKDDCGGAYPPLQMAGGVRLLVKSEDLEDAEKILDVKPEDLEDVEKILDEMEAEDAGKIEQEEEPKGREGTKSTPMLILRRSFLFLIGFAAGDFLSPVLRGQSRYTGVVKNDWNDGKPGSTAHYVHDELTLLEEDRNYDDKVDAWHKFVSGKLHTSAYDDRFQGEPNSWVEYKNRFNYVAKMDTDFDGKPDATIYFVNGLKQRIDWHPNDSPIIERRELYEYGLLKEKLVDTNGDGIFDLRITYDSYERPIKEDKCWIRQ